MALDQGYNSDRIGYGITHSHVGCSRIVARAGAGKIPLIQELMNSTKSERIQRPGYLVEYANLEVGWLV